MNFPSLRWYSFWWNCSSWELNLSDSKMAFLYCQLQSCLANALEDCPNVPGKVRSIIGCNSNVVYVLSTLVSFDDWVQVLTHETWKSRHRSAKTLCKSFIGKSSASKIERKHFHCPLVRHLQTVISLGAIQFAEQWLSGQVLGCVWQSANWLVIVSIVFCNQTVGFS